MSVTFFNVDNPEEIIAGELPVLSQRGPYVYREEREKMNADQEGDLLNFGEYKEYKFDSAMSCEECSEDDEIRILNLPLIGVVQECLNQGSLIGGILCGLVEAALHGEFQDELFFKHTVGELLFQGVSTGIVEFLMTNALTQNRLPPQIQENGFALFNGKNATTDNRWYTLDISPASYGIQAWGPTEDDKHDNLGFTSWWPSADYAGEVSASTCNLLTGTDGSQYQAGISEETRLWHFSPDICRSVDLTFDHQDQTDPNNLVFSTPLESFHVNRTRNFCYCPALKPSDSCIVPTEDPDVLDLSSCDLQDCKDGLLDVHACYQSPIILSNPNFYLAEHQLGNFQGTIVPDKERDESRITVNRDTGTVSKAENKLQINMPIVKHPKITVLEKVPDIIFPVIWVNDMYAI
eukprot:GFUD01002680.1.p1 GENE.GFUD01002680.1~~GFUD01002680.1.p1  ORF type:complete len:445 (+),score=120.51 GFUD01002680.1:117-1337(+)